MGAAIVSVFLRSTAGLIRPSARLIVSSPVVNQAWQQSRIAAVRNVGRHRRREKGMRASAGSDPKASSGIGAVARALLVALALAQLLDVLSTNAVLANVPNATEANPVMHFAMDRLGEYWWLPKAALAALYLFFAARLRQAPRRLAVAIGGFASLYAAFVAWNICNLL
jgi:hypothetical protein